MRILVTGGAGFIGSALVRHLIAESAHNVLVYDKLTYAGTLTSLAAVASHERFRFVHADICDRSAVASAFADFNPDIIVHLAAETHVDRSIDGPQAFLDTNLMGTAVLLQEALRHWRQLPKTARSAFRFHHVSTDEVFGALGAEGLFDETTSYDPRSPYSASKAGSDHLVRAWWHTYGLPITVTNCSNNFGPYHFPEKLIPLMIVKALAGETLPVYGRGENVRDWLYVDDHVRAIRQVFEKAEPGQTFTVGGNAQRRNLQVVETVCAILDRLHPRQPSGRYADLIDFVQDRPGHDFRYAIDSSKITHDLGWRPLETFESGLEKTVRWYLDHPDWWQPLIQQPAAIERQGLGTV